MTKEFLLHLFRYDRENGDLIWINPPTKWLCHLIGKKAGNFNKTEGNRGDYLRIRISGKAYSIHKLIWFIEYGTWPKLIDHIDGNVLNNRIGNLRESCSRRNQHNRKSHRAGRLPGTWYRKEQNKWRACINVNGKKLSLGQFNTEQQSHQRYLAELKVRGL